MSTAPAMVVTRGGKLRSGTSSLKNGPATVIPSMLVRPSAPLFSDGARAARKRPSGGRVAGDSSRSYARVPAGPTNTAARMAGSQAKPNMPYIAPSECP
ncbi:hypothetical protein LuPra_01109 [Luteitalea pratensis]|uniref:Uncharacterized protein n=1 Tax=Luteitalea pratensis TaxID=1855912 RepID=A0A143PHB8_LUTPR|nr:hypothetical protein LuPra_01109 [Luteitalea pratensis]